MTVGEGGDDDDEALLQDPASQDPAEMQDSDDGCLSDVNLGISGCTSSHHQRAPPSDDDDDDDDDNVL
jgi:hypothetical protein